MRQTWTYRGVIPEGSRFLRFLCSQDPHSFLLEGFYIYFYKCNKVAQKVGRGVGPIYRDLKFEVGSWGGGQGGGALAEP